MTSPGPDAAARRELIADLLVIAERCSSLPVLDDRPADVLLGYDAAAGRPDLRRPFTRTAGGGGEIERR